MKRHKNKQICIHTQQHKMTSLIVLVNFCRASEILYSMMWAEMEYVGSDVTELSEPLMEHIVVARRSLSLFQGRNSIDIYSM